MTNYLTWSMQLEWLLRLIVAGFCGYAIGYERNARAKEAGVRTHLVVAMGAALIMIVSKYGFMDIIGIRGIALDPSRIAAQIVTGIGFLGAGMIFVRHRLVSGLTTAAGIWVTAGIGMAVGAKLYFIGIATTALVLLFQMLLHHNIPWLNTDSVGQVFLVLERDFDAVGFVRRLMRDNNIELINMKIDKSDETTDVLLHIQVPQDFDNIAFLSNLNKNKHVISAEI